MPGLGYRVPAVLDPETTRHGAEFHPTTQQAHYLTSIARTQRKNDQGVCQESDMILEFKRPVASGCDSCACSSTGRAVRL